LYYTSHQSPISTLPACLVAPQLLQLALTVRTLKQESKNFSTYSKTQLEKLKKRLHEIDAWIGTLQTETQTGCLVCDRDVKTLEKELGSMKRDRDIQLNGRINDSGVEADSLKPKSTRTNASISEPVKKEDIQFWRTQKEEQVKKEQERLRKAAEEAEKLERTKALEDWKAKEELREIEKRKVQIWKVSCSWIF
jgi:hypothetical protein